MHLGEAVICCGFGGLFLHGSTLVWPCRLLLGAGAAFSADACHGFAQHLLDILPLPGGVTGMTSTCGGLRAGPPCSGDHWPVGGQVCASELCCKVGGMGASPLNLPQSRSQVSLLSWHLLGSSDVLWSALPSPHLSLGTAISWPQGPSGLVFTRPPAPLKPGSRTTGVVPLDRLRPWPCVHVSRKPPAAQAASVSRGRTCGPHGVLWVLSLHSCQQRWTLAAPGAMGRARGPAPKPHGPWVQLGFQLCAWTACCRLFPGTCQGRSPRSCG